MRRVLLISLSVLIGLVFTISSADHKASATVPGYNVLISQNSTGGLPNSNGNSIDSYSLLSGDGRYVAFTSSASDLVSGDTNNRSDAFVRDNQTGTTVMASIAPWGGQMTNTSTAKAISNDGRYVLFTSESSAPYLNVYLRDLVNNTTTIVANNGYNTGAGGLSADGRFALLSTKGPMITGLSSGLKNQVYSQDTTTGQNKILSVDSSGNVGNSDSSGTGMSCDGNVIAFISSATNLPGNSGVTNGNTNLFLAVIGWSGVQLTNVTNIATGTSVRSGQVSCDGNVVSYVLAPGNNIVGAYEYNRLTKAVAQASLNTAGSLVPADSVSISGDGRYVAFMGRGNTIDPSYPSTGAGAKDDIYVHDMKKNTTQLVTVTATGTRSGSVDYCCGYAVSLSADGSKLAFPYITPSNANTALELISGLNTGSASTQRDVYESDTGF